MHQGGAWLRPGSLIVVIWIVILYRQLAGALLQQERWTCALVEFKRAHHIVGGLVAIGQRWQTQFILGEAQHR